MTVLVIDVGTSGLRAAVVRPGGDGRARRATARSRPTRRSPAWSSSTPPRWPPRARRGATGAGRRPARSRPSASRTSAPRPIVWDRATGEPVGPALGWQDLRTVVRLHHAGPARDCGSRPTSRPPSWRGCSTTHDPDRARDLCFGTVDTWVAWMLSRRRPPRHRPRATPASPGCCAPTAPTGTTRCSRRSAHPAARCCPRSSTRAGVVGAATALPGAPPIAGIVGDQQASLVGQGCVRPGLAKITFGTGGMLDVCTGATPPASAARGKAGTFPIVAWTDGGRRSRGASRRSC